MLHIRGTLLKIAAGIGREAGPASEAAMLWPVVCGGRVAQRTRIAAVEDGSVIILVPDAQWRTELLALAPEYLQRFNEALSEPVHRIEFRVAGPEDELQTPHRS